MKCYLHFLFLLFVLHTVGTFRANAQMHPPCLDELAQNLSPGCQLCVEYSVYYTGDGQWHNYEICLTDGVFTAAYDGEPWEDPLDYTWGYDDSEDEGCVSVPVTDFTTALKAWGELVDNTTCGLVEGITFLSASSSCSPAGSTVEDLCNLLPDGEQPEEPEEPDNDCQAAITITIQQPPKPE